MRMRALTAAIALSVAAFRNGLGYDLHPSMFTTNLPAGSRSNRRKKAMQVKRNRE